jgi:hypothetical protein
VGRPGSGACTGCGRGSRGHSNAAAEAATAGDNGRDNASDGDGSFAVFPAVDDEDNQNPCSRRRPGALPIVPLKASEMGWSPAAPPTPGEPSTTGAAAATAATEKALLPTRSTATGGCG